MGLALQQLLYFILVQLDLGVAEADDLAVLETIPHTPKQRCNEEHNEGQDGADDYSHVICPVRLVIVHGYFLSNALLKIIEREYEVADGEVRAILLCDRQELLQEIDIVVVSQIELVQRLILDDVAELLLLNCVRVQVVHIVLVQPVDEIHHVAPVHLSPLFAIDALKHDLHHVRVPIVLLLADTQRGQIQLRQIVYNITLNA